MRVQGWWGGVFFLGGGGDKQVRAGMLKLKNV